MHFKKILYLVHGMKVHGVSSSWVHHFIEKCVYGAGFPRFFPAQCQWLKRNGKCKPSNSLSNILHGQLLIFQ